MKETLIFLRTKNRYSQNAIAKELGISRQAYIKYETGEVEPSVAIIRKLSKIFNVSYKALIDNDFGEKAKNSKDCITYKINRYDELKIASPAPSYGTAFTNNNSRLLHKIYSSLNLLSEEQLSSVLNIVQSVNKLNSSSSKNGPVKQKRSPGGLNGSLWISDDFDEPLDDFKEYM